MDPIFTEEQLNRMSRDDMLSLVKIMQGIIRNRKRPWKNRKRGSSSWKRKQRNWNS